MLHVYKFVVTIFVSWLVITEICRNLFSLTNYPFRALATCHFLCG